MRRIIGALLGAAAAAGVFVWLRKVITTRLANR